jgi:hypothetical protein
VFEGTRQARRQTDCVADQATAVCDELRQGAPRGAVRAKGGELVTVFEEDLDLERGIGGIICGPAGGTCCAVPGQGERMDGTAHEAILLAPCVHHGPFLQLTAHSDGGSVASRPQGADPRIDRVRAVREDQKRSFCRARGLEADLVCGLRPVEANKGRKCFACLWLPVCSPRV